MKQLLPEYDRQSDGVDYIAINVRAATPLGRALSLGTAWRVETNYHGNFSSLGGVVRYFARPNDPFCREATGAEQDMEISTTFDDVYSDVYTQLMWETLSKIDWVMAAMVANRLPFVYYVNYGDGDGLQPVRMPQWFAEAVEKCVSNARAGKFVKQAEKSAVPGPLQPWSFPSTPVRGEESSPLEQCVEKEVKPRRARKTVVTTTDPTIDLKPAAAEVGSDLPPWALGGDKPQAAGPVNDEPTKQPFENTKFEKKAAKQRLTKTANRAVATKMDMVMAGRTSNDSTTYLGKNKADIQLWFKRLQALSVEQKALVDQILEPFDDLVGRPVPDEEIRDTHLPLMLKMLENIKDKQVADSIARGVWTYVFDAPYGTEEVIAKLQSYYVPEEE